MSGNRDEEEYETGLYEGRVTEEEAARLRATLANVLAVLPPSPGSLPGCSPSVYSSSTPYRFPEALVMDGDTILVENETQNSHSRRPSRIETIPKIQEPSPTKSQFSDIVRSIGSPNPSLASTETSTARRDSFSVESDDNTITVPWNGGMEICARCPTTGREFFYKLENNAGTIGSKDFIVEPDDSRSSRKISKANIFPTVTGLGPRDAFDRR